MAAQVLRVLAYPITTGGAVAFCLWAIARGWPVWAIGVVVITAASVAAEILERLIPYSPAWARSRGDLGTDVLHNVVSNRAFDLGTFAAIAAFAPLGGWLSARLDLPLWPHHWPVPVQALLALALVELPWYWLHRLGHASALCWRVHAVHHSSERLYWWNLARNHPIDNLVSAAASIGPLALLGVGEAPLSLVAAFSGAHAMLQHSNADLRTGFLDIFLATPRVHRWHHSPRADESMANYGPTLTLWDHVFGTRRFAPDAAPPEDVGLGHSSFPARFVGQLRAPFDRRLWRR